MSEEISQAVQIIRVAYDGVDVAMRVGSGGVKAMFNIASFIFGMLDHEKLKGQTTMKKLLMKGGDLQVVKLDNSQMKEAKKLLKKYGVLYSTLPDLNKSDDMSEILIHSEAVPRVNMILEKLGKGLITSLEDYMENGEKSGFDEFLKFFEKERNKGVAGGDEKEVHEKAQSLMSDVADFAVEKDIFSKEEISEHFNISEKKTDNVLTNLLTIGALKMQEDGTYKSVMEKDEFVKRVKEYQELAKKIKINAELQNDGIEIFKISKNSIAGEDEKFIKISASQRDDRFVFIEKGRLLNAGKEYIAFLNRDDDILIYDKKDKPAETVPVNDAIQRIQNIQLAKTAKEEKEKQKKQVKEKQIKEKGKAK